jgi:8-oxo-dGTP diphosphatase
MRKTKPRPLPAPAPLSAFPLKTERLTLRPLRPEDAPAVHRVINDWEVVRMLSRLPFPYPRDLADDWIASTTAEMAQGSAYHLAITGEENGQELLIGGIGLTLEGEPGVARLGYWVARRYWGHGVATEAARRMVSWALANLDITVVRAGVLLDNAASAAVLRRVGFRETGRAEEFFVAHNAPQPIAVYEARRNDVFGEVESGGKKVMLVAACALIDTDTRVLLARRPEGKKMAGLWEFPGGKVNPGETPEAALIRELHEELGIDVTETCLAPFTFASHAYENFHLLMPLYLCRRWRGFVQPMEGQALAWVRPSKLTDYDMPEADKPLVPLLRDFL